MKKVRGVAEMRADALKYTSLHPTATVQQVAAGIECSLSDALQVTKGLGDERCEMRIRYGDFVDTSLLFLDGDFAHCVCDFLKSTFDEAEDEREYEGCVVGITSEHVPSERIEWVREHRSELSLKEFRVLQMEFRAYEVIDTVKHRLAMIHGV